MERMIRSSYDLSTICTVQHVQILLHKVKLVARHHSGEVRLEQPLGCSPVVVPAWQSQDPHAETQTDEGSHAAGLDVLPW